MPKIINHKQIDIITNTTLQTQFKKDLTHIKDNNQKINQEEED